MGQAVATEFTVSEKILLAAADLEKAGKAQFTAEDLVVGSWKQWQETFGLRGYEAKFPDSNKVLSSVMGERGLAKRGWLLKVGQKLYAMTKEGRTRATQLRGEDAKESTNGNGHNGSNGHFVFPKDQAKLLLSLFGSAAFQKFNGGKKTDITFSEACKFWGLGPAVQGDDVEEHINDFTVKLLDVETILEEGPGRLVDNGQILAAGDIRALRNISSHLETKFERHLSLLSSRKGKP